MWDKLKKAFHNVKAMVSGAAAYVETLFTTPGTFAEANSAAQAAYTQAYDRSMGESNPSLTGALRQAVRGNFRDAANQAVNSVERAAENAVGTGQRHVRSAERRVNNFIDRAANSMQDMEQPRKRGAQPIDFEPDVRAHQAEQEARAANQEQRRTESAIQRNAMRDKHGLSKDRDSARRDADIAAAQPKKKSSSFRQSVQEERSNPQTKGNRTRR